MDRLIRLEPSNTVAIEIEPGQKCSGSISLRNVMHTMPVAFRIQPLNKTRYTVVPHSGIILPLTTLTLEITYQLSPNSSLPYRYPHCDDSFVLQSVVAPGAGVKNPTSTYDSVPNDWFTNKKKQVYSDSGIKIMFVGSMVLSSLVAKGCMDEIREVLEKSVPNSRAADSVDSEGNSLLHLAVAQSRPDLVQLLLEFEPDIEATNRTGSSPLEAASASGEELIVELLLAHKASPERSEFSTWGPIHLATGNGHVQVLRHLLLKGANPNSLTKDGNTALHLAVEEKRRDCARLLLANAARSDIQNTSDGDTPLHTASTIGDEQMVKLLLHKGANKDIRNKQRKTAYDLAAENGHTNLFDVLKLADKLCTAARKGELRMILKFLENGASIHGRDQNGWTALHRASFKGRIDVTRMLIEKGIDVNAKDEDGYTALHCAVESGQVDVIELLVKRGADVEAKTNKGVTAVQIAESLNYTGIIRILVQGGAAKDGVLQLKSKQNSVAFGKGISSREMDTGVVKKNQNHSRRVRRSSFDHYAPLAVV
ncbi:protein VAPYRIN-like [Primulina huaijiensis]|uniref:protein VAPYRIN-like n=1 Tax=Primulina huaijiensis TaxID=1492673 RepID=UPI003CC772DB